MALRKASAAPASRQAGGEPTGVPVGGRGTLGAAIAKDFIATSYGPPWGGLQGSGITSDGTNLRNNPHIYGVAVDPNVIPMGTDLFIWPNPFGYKGSFKAFDTGGAIKGNRIDFYDWRGRAAQNAWGRRSVKVGHTKQTSAGNQGVSLSLPNPLTWAEEAARNFVAFLKIMVDPVQLGEHVAKVLVWMIKMFVKAFYNVIVRPPWRWTQRATIFYWENYVVADEVSGGRRYAIGVKAIVTMGFWATGYAILWGRFDPTEVGVDARDSALTTTLGASRDAYAARRITKPKDVESKTAKKPTPATTSVPLEVTRTVAASRRRTVKVTDNTEGQGNGGGRTDDPAQEQQQGAEVVQ